MRLGPNDLLEYHAGYGVLICRDCQYTIQKNAVGGHLLRHKIYRNDRQQLLALIESLHLHEPEDVPLPHPESPPIEAIPIISGHACTETGCPYLCASLKRMKRHWSEVHGPVLGPISRQATLQTFFRGTKLRYFEVSVAPAADPSALIHNKAQNAPLLQSSAKIPAFKLDIDLEMLTYFHHFITKTSFTLPMHPGVSLHYWQEQVVPLALQHKWLMCGLLATSALHMTINSNDSAAKKTHGESFFQLSSEFSTGWKAMERPGIDITDSTASSIIDTVHRQIDCILNYAGWVLSEFSQIEETEPQLEALMRSIHDLAYPRKAPSTLVQDSSFNLPPNVEDVFSRASRLLGEDPEVHQLQLPPIVLDRLRALPHRMAEVFGKPEHAMDAYVPLIAIAALSECCMAGYSSDSESNTWHAMTSWLANVPEYFYAVVLRDDPAALVVLAYWAALLVGRAEDCGCWFVAGLKRTILAQICQRLATNEAALQLIADLIT